MTKLRLIRKFHFSLILLATVGCLASCGEKNAYVAPPPPAVDVQKPLVQTITVYEEFQARTESFERYEARARVTGFLEAREFTEGQFVEAGDPLFLIDPTQFKAAVTRAQGDLDKATAQVTLATENYKKRLSASESGAVSKIDVATALAEKEIAVADVAIAAAALADAETELGYTKIKSKISGRVSRTLVDVGNLVSGTEGTLLATVIRDDPLFATFEVSERRILEFLSRRPSENDAPNLEKKILRLTTTDGKILSVLKDGVETPILGKWHSLDNEVKADTGTIEVSSLFDNPENTLAAGLSVKIGRPVEIPDAILIPRDVLQSDIGGSYIMVLGEGNKAARRNVEISEFTMGDLAIVESGISAEDKVILNNLQRARDDIPVNPTEIPVATLPAELAGDKPAPAEPTPAPVGEKG